MIDRTKSMLAALFADDQPRLVEYTQVVGNSGKRQVELLGYLANVGSLVKFGYIKIVLPQIIENSEAVFIGEGFKHLTWILHKHYFDSFRIIEIISQETIAIKTNFL